MGWLRKMTKNVIFRKWHEKVSFCTDLLTDKAIPVQYYYNWRPSTSYLEQSYFRSSRHLLTASLDPQESTLGTDPLVQRIDWCGQQDEQTGSCTGSTARPPSTRIWWRILEEESSYTDSLHACFINAHDMAYPNMQNMACLFISMLSRLSMTWKKFARR